MNNFWPNVVKSMDPALFNRMKERMQVTVSREDYEIFCKEFVFDTLRGESFGEAF